MTSDLTFLTNETDRLLSTRLNVLLSKSHRFDCLVGYFYLSGFYLIQKALEPCEKIRILIGLETESKVYQALQESKIQREFEFRSTAETVKTFKDDVLKQIDNADETAEVETGIEQFVRWCSEGKVEVRAYDKHPIHAKLYIFSFDKNQVDKGRVITGSSNLSLSGLKNNLEFNVELKNRNDYDFASEKFEELWKESVEVSEEFVRTVKNESHLAQFSPYQLFLKFLYEYFRTELNQPRKLDQDYQPEGFMRLQYQHDAVLTAKRIVQEYNGVFIADVVGLGKTYMAAMLARELDGRCLVIAPPALTDKNNPGAWQNVFHDFGVRGFHVESIGKLDKILKLDLSKFQYVFIDEAHRFRNEDNETYEKLHKICKSKAKLPNGELKEKGIVLVTATPFNNRPNDLLSLLKLFQSSRNSLLPNLPNLDNFFRNLNSRLQKFHRVKDREDYLKTMRENAREVRERILKYLMVRRTRTEISNYYGEDLAKQGLKFPEVADPQAIFYELSSRENEIFTRTIERIAKNISYSRYRPLIDRYFTGELNENRTTAQNNLAAFMKVLLVKRLESSFEAFRLTLGRFISTYQRFIKAYQNGYVYVSKKRTSQIFDLIEKADFAAIEKLIEDEEAEKYGSDEFNPAFIADLENDLQVLRLIEEDWKSIYRDPKWDKLKVLLQNDRIFHNSKLLFFTESKETAEYLANRIKDELDEKVICFSGSSGNNLREEVINNFDARVRQPKDDYRILITTDTLAEGVSLHRSNVVTNYDIPWNPTRMMQRVGRINRVDTKFEQVYTYNFLPSKEGEDAIGLQAAAEAKIEAFIEMLGADAKLLTENEEIKSFNLFDRINSKATITGESDDDENSELRYLQIIRDVQNHEKELFSVIKYLPKKARSAQKIKSTANQDVLPNSLFTYFRLGKLDKFYLANADNHFSNEIDFLEAANILETDIKHKLSVGRDFFALLHKNQTALATALQVDHETGYAPSSNYGSVTKVQKILKTYRNQDFSSFTEDEEQFWQSTIKAIENGSVAKRTISAILKDVKNKIDAREILEVLKRRVSFSDFLDNPKEEIKVNNEVSKVILSEYFLG
jgi:superfamily II DNA/RNA helicase